MGRWAIMVAAMLAKHKTIALVATLLALLLLPIPARATTTPSNVPNQMRDYAGSVAAEDLLIRVDEALNAITYTYYSTVNVWDALRGIYKVVCAGYMNHVLDEALPSHYDAIRDYFGKGRLGIWDYYSYFRAISYGSSKGGWKRITRVTDLRPGDVIVWKYSEDSSSPAWGHGVVAVGLPERDYRWSGVYKLRISDSTRSPHSNDNRGTAGSGVGAGEMLFKVDSDGKPVKYAWTLKGYFKSDINGMALVRPIN
ncbi:MAG: hypothetical protein HY698_10980 [Deltaproteobacteria bacterium]|nr:hypothetical protein [Deltaproteobacteria bacterium]